MKKIDFIIIGAQKSGTTTLYDWIKQNPAVFLPEMKEMPYFVKEDCFERGETYLEMHYSQAEKQLAWGAAHANNMFFPYVAQRIYDYSPQMKIIAVLRNPIDRAYSAYWYMKRQTWENAPSFEKALQRESEEKNSSFDELSDLTYLSHGHYYNQLLDYYKYFGTNNILILLTEQIKNNPAETLNNVWKFLNLENYNVNFSEKSNEAAMPRIGWLHRLVFTHSSWYKTLLRFLIPLKLRTALNQRIYPFLERINLRKIKYPPMEETTRLRLTKHFQPHNEKLSGLIGIDLRHWNNDKT